MLAIWDRLKELQFSQHFDHGLRIVICTSNSVLARLSVYICLFLQVANNFINSMRSIICTIYHCQRLLNP